MLGQRGIVFIARSRTQGLEHRLQIEPCGPEDSVLSPFLLCVKMSSLLLDL